ncbi:amidohydrolase family-domain-containing protein [Triangularia verruculosa]|uniref:Amidohydrolase family-domain-containing protein n=1 Tax=Triangularia verruculosa TaxID=2587418 RepID=A0AAN6XHK9_9PEZI|nr:amidohydrolase family-domain-containing protein [Triangularia verruculosa]
MFAARVLLLLLSFTFRLPVASPSSIRGENITSTVPISSFVSRSGDSSTQFVTEYQSSGSLRGSVLLYNGRIHTLTAGNPVVSILAIKDGYITYAGDLLSEAEHTLSQSSSSVKKINLRRRVAVPGLIDCHNHIVLLGNRPGYHTPLEQCFSISDVKSTYRRRATQVPKDGWITTIGGFSPNQFKESRLPLLEELDSEVGDRPVFISTGFSGPATTNTRGKKILETEAGVTVAVNGSIASGVENGKALLWLRRNLLGFEERKRSVRSAMEYAASVGVTTHLDQGAFSATNTSSDGAASEDLYTFHLPWLSVYSDLQGIIRLRVNFLHDDSTISNPTLVERLRNTFPFFGNDMVRTGAIGEFAVGLADYAGGPVFEAAALKIAKAGWRLEVHALGDNDLRTQLEGFEKINAEVSIKNLRWVVAHVPRISVDSLNRLKALGAGVNVSGWLYLAGSGNATNPAGPPFRRILDSGIHVGFGPDGANIAPLSPWPHAYYAVTGKNAKGELINSGQSITRQEVLELFTKHNTWFLGGPDEHSLGVLEKGRLGDVAVLSEDYFTIPEERIKQLRSVLTVVGGVVVWNSGEL